MKWSIVGLILVGVIAALCVSVLVNVLRTESGRQAATVNAPIPEVEILVAAKDIPAGSLVDASHVGKKTLRPEEAPEGSLFDEVQVLGRVLKVRVVEGEAFTKTRFAEEGSGRDVAGFIRPGMRAVGVLLPSHSGLRGLLYPGCIVDVLVAFKPKSGMPPSSETLLEGVQVLSIEDKTIVSPQEDDKESLVSGVRTERTRQQMVTLCLNPEQAQVLQAASEHGTISLTMRNPLDDSTRADRGESGPAAPEEKAMKILSPPRHWEMEILRNREKETKQFQIRGDDRRLAGS